MTERVLPAVNSPWGEGIRFSERPDSNSLEIVQTAALVIVAVIIGFFAIEDGADEFGIFCFGFAGLCGVFVLAKLAVALLALVRREPIPNFIVTRAGVIQSNGFKKRRIDWRDISSFRRVADPYSEIESFGAVAFGIDQAVPESRRAQWREAKLRLVLQGTARDGGRADELFCNWLNEWRAAMLKGGDFPDIDHLQPILERAQLKFLP